MTDSHVEHECRKGRRSMTELNDDVVERARQALAGIETPTPWVAKWGGVYGTSGPKNTYRGTDGSPSVATAEGGFVEGEFLEGDADFIAAAPDLVCDLAAEVERLTAERDEARTEVERLEADLEGAAYRAGRNQGELAEARAAVERLRTDLARMTGAEAGRGVGEVGIEGPHPVDRASAAQLRRALDGEASGE